MVRQAINVGFLDRAAKDKAAWIMVRIMTIDLLGRPAIGGETFHHVVRAGRRGFTVDRDAVVVIQDGQLGQTEVSRER